MSVAQVGNAGEPQTQPAVRADAAEREAAALVSRMTLDEKIQLVAGKAGLQFFPGMPPADPAARGGDGFVPGVPRLGIPDQQIIGSGLGVTDWFLKRPDGAATALPSTLAVASSWSTALARDYGVLIGRETRAQGFNIAIGGGLNISREPRGGRAFEYHGEDPVLAGKLMAQTIRGTQEQGVPATVKHFAVNDFDNARYGMDVRIGERAMRESDLLAFEIAIKESEPAIVMCSYNLLNGVYACENDALLNGVLKREWGFKGWVMSDWGATHSTAASAKAGLDQEFFTQQYFGKALKAAVQSGEVPQARLDDMVRRILTQLIRFDVVGRNEPVRPIDRAAGRALALRAAEQGAVLLKNDGVLPLAPGRARSIAVIGFNADKGVISGGGSSQVNPFGGSALPPAKYPFGAPGGYGASIWVPSPPLAAIRAQAKGASVTYDPGTDPAKAAATARAADIAIVLAGRFRMEGTDVPDLTLGDGQDAMIEAVAAANPNTVVVLQTGGAVRMPWLAKVKGVLEVWFPGQEGGPAIANLLFGRADPTGKLPLTFPAAEADLPRPALPGPPLSKRSGIVDIFNPTRAQVSYDEGALVGYKWYDAKGKTPLFPFGHGLSYTRFAYRNLDARIGDAPQVSIEIANTGERDGVEIAQVYVSPPGSAGATSRRLAGWARVPLARGRSERVTVTLEAKAFATWDAEGDRWVMPAGQYELSIGSSSRDMRLTRRVRLPAERSFGF